MHFDVLVRGGTVLDGTGAPGRRADVGIVGTTVDAVSDLSAADGTIELDATGLVVSPGFIDTHSHADVAMLLAADAFELALAPLLQGVTTEVCGNCGMSPFPTLPHMDALATESLRGELGGHARSYASLADYRAAMNRDDLPTNLAPLVGHNTLRTGVAGNDDRSVTPDELATMERLLAETFESGAFGFSSGLIYPPGMYADTDELVALAAVAARYGRPYVTHMRSETDRVEAALAEAIDIGRRSGAPVHVSHHKVAGRTNFGRSGQTLATITRARSAGTDLSIDAYPYTAGSSSLMAVLPPWANAGTLPEKLERLQSRAARDRMRIEMAAGLPGWENLGRAAGWDGVVVVGAAANPQYQGLTIPQIADGRDPMDAACDLLVAERGQVTMVLHMMSEEDMHAIISTPFATIGSDGVPIPGVPHPRLTGTFTRVLGRLSRELALVDLPTAVHKMTGLAAARFGLHHRGVITAGAVADVVVFDPATVQDEGTYADPVRRPTGVPHVLVAGTPSVRDGQVTGELRGRVLAAD